MPCFNAHEDGKHKVSNKKNAKIRLNNLFMWHKNNDLNHKSRDYALDLWFLQLSDN